MKKYFSVREAAQAAELTAETLRHYDRIGLVAPSMRDPATHYRYYTAQDIVRLRAVSALQQLDLPLRTIQEALDSNDFEQIIAFLDEAQRQADAKLDRLIRCRERIAAAREIYEHKRSILPRREGVWVQRFAQRAILLSDTLETPTMENLWSYLRHFTRLIPPEKREEFAFADLAGVYIADGISRLYAVCLRYGKMAGLKCLPEGNYLCMTCAEAEQEAKRAELLACARERYGVTPGYMLQEVVVTGILQWNYQLQLPLGDG